MELFREQRTVTVGVSSGLLVAGNMNRHCLVVSSPVPNAEYDNRTTSFASAVSGGSTGVKLSYTAPAGKTAVVTAATSALVSGAAPTIAFEYVSGASTITLTKGTVPQTYAGGLELSAGETVQWDVTVLGAAAVLDLTISLSEAQVNRRITLGFNGPAVLDNGLNLYAGNNPQVMFADLFGPAIREEVTAIGSVAGMSIGILDIFCPCHNIMDTKKAGKR